MPMDPLGNGSSLGRSRFGPRSSSTSAASPENGAVHFPMMPPGVLVADFARVRRGIGTAQPPGGGPGRHRPAAHRAFRLRTVRGAPGLRRLAASGKGRRHRHDHGGGQGSGHDNFEMAFHSRPSLMGERTWSPGRRRASTPAVAMVKARAAGGSNLKDPGNTIPE